MTAFAYTLGHKALAEFLGCVFTCAIGEGLIANEHLPGTKGNGYGFGFIAIGFGLAFAFSINMFGYISAHLNPAMCVCLWVAGKMSFDEVAVVSAAEVAGWFVGACLVFVTYMPHFATVPQPIQDANQRAPMSCAVGRSAMQIASVQPSPDSSESIATYWATPDQLLRRRARGKRENEKKREFVEEFGLKVMDDMERFPRLPRDCLPASQPTGGSQLKKSRSIQIAVVHRALEQMESDTSYAKEDRPKVKDDLHLLTRRGSEPHHMSDAESQPAVDDSDLSLRKKAEEAKQAIEEEYLKAVHADQHVKLAIFATTPAIPNIFMNSIQEFIGSVALFLGVMLLDARFQMTGEPEVAVVDNALKPFLVGFYVVIIILAFGGPTSPSLNPARDLGPRLAHFLLPIPGKGSSNWWYAPHVALADILGGAVAGGLFLAIDAYLNHEMA